MVLSDSLVSVGPVGPWAQLRYQFVHLLQQHPLQMGSVLFPRVWPKIKLNHWFEN